MTSYMMSKYICTFKDVIQLVEIFQSSKSNISEHIKNIIEDKELEEVVVVRKSEQPLTWNYRGINSIT